MCKALCRLLFSFVCEWIHGLEGNQFLSPYLNYTTICPALSSSVYTHTKSERFVSRELFCLVLPSREVKLLHVCMHVCSMMLGWHLMYLQLVLTPISADGHARSSGGTWQVVVVPRSGGGKRKPTNCPIQSLSCILRT